MSQGIVMVDQRGRLAFCNDSYLEMYGLTRADLSPDSPAASCRAAPCPRHARLLGRRVFRRNEQSGGFITELPNGRASPSSIACCAVAAWSRCMTTAARSATSRSQLATTKKFLESVIDNVPVCIAAKNIEDGRYILANRAFERFSRLSREKILGKRADEIFSPATAATIADADRRATASPDRTVPQRIDGRARREIRTLASNRVDARNDKDQPEFLIALFEDITEHKSLSQELENTKKFLELVVDNIPVALIVERVSDGTLPAGQPQRRDHPQPPPRGRHRPTAADIFNPKEAKLIVSRDEAAIKKRGMLSEEHPISTKAGLRLFLTRRATVLDEAGEPQYLIKTHEDVTDRRQTEARMAHMAYHDGLTDLPNRAAFLQALSQMIEACEGTGDEFAVLVRRSRRAEGNQRRVRPCHRRQAADRGRRAASSSPPAAASLRG